MIISCWILLRMRNVPDSSSLENRSTHFMFNNFFFDHRTSYEIMWKDIVERGRPQMTIWRMRIACWVPKATNAHPWNMKYLLLFHCINGCTKCSQCYVKRILPLVLFKIFMMPSLFCRLLYYIIWCGRTTSHLPYQPRRPLGESNSGSVGSQLSWNENRCL